MIYSPSPKPASPVPSPPGSFLTYTAHVQGHHLTPSPPNWAIHPESCEQPTPRLLSSAALGTPHAGSRNGCRWTFLAPGVSSDTFICACRPGDRSLLPYHTSGLAKPVHPVSSEEAEGKGGWGGSREEGPVRASGGHGAGRCTTHGPRRVWKQVCLHRKGRSSKDDQPTQEGPRLGSAVGEGSTKKARGFPRQRTCRLQEVIELLPQHPIYSLSFPHCSYGRGSRLKGGSTCSPPSTQGCWEH